MKLNDLFSSSISLAKDGWASKEEWKNRIKECSNCEYLTKSMRCKECGCFMKAKVRIKGAVCPLGKW